MKGLFALTIILYSAAVLVTCLPSCPTSFRSSEILSGTFILVDDFARYSQDPSALLLPNNLINKNIGSCTSGSCLLGLKPKSTDYSIYNYTLNSLNPMPTTIPQVALAISEFESRKSAAFNLEVRQFVNSSSNVILTNRVIQIMVRTTTKTATWVKATVNFIYVLSPNFRAGSEFLSLNKLRNTKPDTNTSNTSTPLSQEVFCTFRSWWDTSKPSSAQIFLNGFDIELQSLNPGLSNFEVQLGTPVINRTGLLFNVSTITRPKIYSILVSYLVFNSAPNNNNIIEGTQKLINPQATNTKPYTTALTSSFVILNFLYGISGFSFNYTSNPALSIILDYSGNATIQQTQNSFAYSISYSYVILTDSTCQYCVVYSLNYNDTCVFECPQNTYSVDGDCIICSNYQIFSQAEQKCVAIQSTYLNSAPNFSFMNFRSVGSTASYTTSSTPFTSSSSLTSSMPLTSIPFMAAPTNLCFTNCPPNKNLTGSRPAAVIPQCPAAKYYNQDKKECQPCPPFCQSCNNSDGICTSCYSGFQLKPSAPNFPGGAPTCQQVCGDGIRISLKESTYCDDGNNMDGDGCSSACQIENGYTCAGGSPNTRDVCVQVPPSQININLLNQKLESNNSLTLDVSLNFVPQDVLKFVNALFRVSSGSSFVRADITYLGSKQFRIYVDKATNSPVKLQLNPPLVNQFKGSRLGNPLIVTLDNRS